MDVIIPLGTETAAVERLNEAIRVGLARHNGRDIQLLLHQLLADVDITIVGYGTERTIEQKGL